MQRIFKVYLNDAESGFKELTELLESGYKVVTATPVLKSHTRPSGVAVETEKIIYILEG